MLIELVLNGNEKTKQMKELLFILFGGICSALGGCVSIWYQAKKARKIRMEELRGEQQLEACKKALSLTDKIYTFSIQGIEDDVLKLLDDEGEWFSMNQVLLPHNFVENWRSIRTNLRKLKMRKSSLQKMSDDPEQDKAIKDIEEIDDFVQQLIEEMDAVIRKELGLKQVKTRKPEKKTE